MRRLFSENSALLVLLLSVALTACAPAQDEATGDPRDLVNDGYKPTQPSDPGSSISVPKRHSLEWPVEFQDETHIIGNTMAQYQPYDGSYWHGGCDVRVKAGAAVRAPVSGKLEAGHYSYAIHLDGSMTKYWKPWPETGNNTYFEVAIVADDGTRYEFHHVNRSTLPDRIVSILDSGGRVNAGDLLGHAIRWSDGVYHHIHYNVIAKNGVRINPEYISKSITDTVAPEIKAAYAVMPSGSTMGFGSGEFSEAPSEFVINVSDALGKNIYRNPPTMAQLTFESGKKTVWDFRKTLSLPDGSLPKLWDFFKSSLKLPLGGTSATSGGYGVGTSLVRLKVPADARGAFKIQFYDQSENVTTLNGKID